MHPGELRSSHAELAVLPALQLDAEPRSYKIFTFIDTSQNNEEDSVENPFLGKCRRCPRHCWRGQSAGEKAVMEKLAPEQTEQGTTRIQHSSLNSGFSGARECQPQSGALCHHQQHKQGRDRSQKQPQKGKHGSAGRVRASA